MKQTVGAGIKRSELPEHGQFMSDHRGEFFRSCEGLSWRPIIEDNPTGRIWCVWGRVSIGKRKEIGFYSGPMRNKREIELALRRFNPAGCKLDQWEYSDDQGRTWVKELPE